MIAKRTIWAFQCERCGYDWIPRKPWNEGGDLPTVCPSCKSPYWNKPRVVDTPNAALRRAAERSLLVR